MVTATDIINLFDLDNQIFEISGRFRYRFFDPIEQVDESCRFLESPGNERQVPRYNLIQWNTNQKGLVNIGLSEENQLVHKENFFFASDLSPSYSVLARDDKTMLQEQSHAISDNSTTGSKLDYLLKTVNSNEYTEDLEKNLDLKGSTTVIPVLDPTTNRPVEKVEIFNKEHPPDIQLRGMNVNSILTCSSRSPLNRRIYDGVLDNAKNIQDKFESLSKTKQEQRKLSTIFTSIADLQYRDEDSNLFMISRKNRDDSFLQNWTLVGFVISKYRMNKGKEVYMYSRFTTGTSFRDPYVAYGQTYRYQLRPVYAKYVSNKKEKGVFVDSTVVFVGSSESVSIDIECTELKVPSPPSNPKFEYVGDSNIKVSWTRPQSYVVDENIQFDTDDIKGYQIFLRNSLVEPYRLYRYFTFNNTRPANLRMHALETIPDDKIISSEYAISDSIAPDDIPRFYEYTEYVLPIRSNVNYYFALCSIDAHGNSSDYSAQYKIRRNNVTGEVDIQLISPVGAPKQYPNLLVPGKLVQPSFKASGYKYMDVFFAPDSTASVPNFGMESVNIQLFDLETEVEKNVKITLTEMP